MTFSENLKKLPVVEHLSSLELLNSAGQRIASIENKPGKAGSLAVYAYLAQSHGGISVAAAQEGLVLFAEHADDARAHPGNHPNIDRLFEVLSTNQALGVRLIERSKN